ncbi:GNAT family N-acetyltransferase [Microvirga yunnanensis]|uniref:GNAT family N-acetyltransferase n=1 Tax=Microvirga yunnanensis TaxID=2953740 RepID=UPI0021C7DCE6|nr:GNAT family N-acetyltransferase [Microvirga sp. HBU65207]
MTQARTDAGQWRIRPAYRQDEAALFDICLRTADAGGDASALYGDPRYPGLIWAVPYLILEPSHAFVLTDGARTLGYVVGTPDSLAFEERLEREWWPGLREGYALRRPERPSDQDILGRIREPERTSPDRAAAYPAHLHVNLLPEAQGRGWGRAMIEAEMASLKTSGASAVHLGVSLANEKVVPFYKKLGFREIARDQAIILGRPL